MNKVVFSSNLNPAPEPQEVGFFETQDGVKLRYAVFSSLVSNDLGTIVLVQGRNEFIEKYYETVVDLTKKGFTVATFDLRGQGGSSRLVENARAGYVEKFSDYEADLIEFIRKISEETRNKSTYVVAHSLGGLITLYAAPRLDRMVKKIVLCAPFVGLPTSGWKSKLIQLLAGINCALGRGAKMSSGDAPHQRIAINDVTSDTKRFERNNKFALENVELSVGPPTWRWIFECLSAIHRVTSAKHLEEIKIETLVFGATNDQVVSYPATKEMMGVFPLGRLRSLEGAEHEILQESDRHRQRAIDEMVEFFTRKNASPES